MRTIYEAYDGEKFDTEEACLRHEKESPLFRAYDREGRPIEVGQEVFLLHLIANFKGGEAFARLCEKRGELVGGITRYSPTGWYWWNGTRYFHIDETMVRAMMRACHKIEITD